MQACNPPHQGPSRLSDPCARRQVESIGRVPRLPWDLGRSDPHTDSDHAIRPQVNQCVTLLRTREFPIITPKVGAPFVHVAEGRVDNLGESCSARSEDLPALLGHGTSSGKRFYPREGRPMGRPPSTTGLVGVFLQSGVMTLCEDCLPPGEGVGSRPRIRPRAKPAHSSGDESLRRVSWTCGPGPLRVRESLDFGAEGSSSQTISEVDPVQLNRVI